MHWNDLWSALALVLIIEGVIPFINPKAFKQYLSAMQELSESTIRRFGLIIMIIGVLTLFIVRQ